MLVLSRKVNEEIRIGDVRVVLLGLRHGNARIGIDAPRDVAVVRSELLERNRWPEDLDDAEQH